MKKTSRRIIVGIVVVLFLFLTLFPVFCMITASLKSDVQIENDFAWFTQPMHFDNYSIAFTQIYHYVLNSVIVTVGVVCLSLVVSLLAGYSFAKFEFPGKIILFFAMIALMMVPGILTLVPQFIISKNLGILNTYIVQILPLTAADSILSTFLIKTFIESQPKSLFEMIELEGAGVIKTLIHLVAPLCMPVLAIVAIMNTTSAWNNYLWPLVSANQGNVRPVIIAIMNLIAPVGRSRGVAFAAYIISSIPLLLIYSIFTKQLISGLTSGALKA